MEQEQTQKPKQTRSSRKSFANQLQDALTDAAKATSENREISICKLIQARIEHLAPLAAEEREENKKQNDAALREQNAAHEAAQNAIQELTAKNERLMRQAEAHVCPVTVREVQNPEQAKVLAERDMLRSVVAFLSDYIGSKEQTAIQAIRTLEPSVAERVCQSVGIKYNEYRQYLMTYSTFRSLSDVIERADSDADSTLLRFCRAAIVLSNPTEPTPKKDFDPSSLRTLEDQLTEVRAQRERLETMRLAEI